MKVGELKGVEHFQEKTHQKLIEEELISKIVKSFVETGLCDKALIQVTYSIGIAKPLSIFINTYGTVKPIYSDKKIIEIVEKNFDLRPGIIIRALQLKTPLFARTVCGGHFSREDKGFP